MRSFDVGVGPTTWKLVLAAILDFLTGAHQIADRRPEFAVGDRLVQQDQAALLRLFEAIGGGVAGNQHGGDIFIVLGLQALDDGDAVLAVAQAIVADDQIRADGRRRDALQHFGA